ncbi:triacylglycerol lipase 1 isoform X2 [Tripterygium wilfordii]|uniref:triacylglycerol lipase 1 isoform X2 n=1 Tax=Tripterygium wilfordii TaxID=458696 RepID=UPI0018F83E47|nr:triacylglycerol lipase 1 isoform X2 [Tripterygium wilfordii]
MEMRVLVVVVTVLSLSATSSSAIATSSSSYLRLRSPNDTLCAQLILPAGYPCTEHKIQTKDGYLLGLQRVSSQVKNLRIQRGPPVLLLHGFFMAGDAWFLDSPQQSLGFILADQGFDVWVGNVRGTFWSHGHISLSEKDKAFWDWSWEDMAMYDLAEMVHCINSVTDTKVFVVGHSQGTIMSLAALTQPNVAAMVKAAALLAPISYLDHITATLVLRMVSVHLDQMILAMGIHQLNFRSDILLNLLDSLCDSGVDCVDWLTSITGKNCCFNDSRVDFYFNYEPHPSSAKNLRHYFQMIRKGTFSQYDYGVFENLKIYGQLKPPAFELSQIPKSLPLWMAYGGKDALADVTDLQHTLANLESKPELLYLENYGHLDFLLSTKANEDIFSNMIGFFRSFGKSDTL